MAFACKCLVNTDFFFISGAPNLKAKLARWKTRLKAGEYRYQKLHMDGPKI
jgi:hypothetical protein